jgi:phosphonopyruvate decarboxylase
MDSNGEPYAFIMKKGMVSPCALEQGGATQDHDSGRLVAPRIADCELPTRHNVLKQLVDGSDENETVLIASTGFNGRELYAIGDRPNQLYMVGSMGCATSLGLGLALVKPDKKVIVIDGDGALLMRMGNLAMVGAHAGDNFYHLLLDNQVHESTGGQATVGHCVDFPAVALASGYQSVLRAGAGQLSVNGFLGNKAPAFMYVKTCQGVAADLPRPSVKPAQVARRLMGHLGIHTPWISAE